MPNTFVTHQRTRSIFLAYVILAVGLLYAVTTVQTVSNKADTNQIKLIHQNRAFITELCRAQARARKDINATRKVEHDLYRNTLKLQAIARTLQPPPTPALARLYATYVANLKMAISGEKPLPRPGCLKFIKKEGHT